MFTFVEIPTFLGVDVIVVGVEAISPLNGRVEAAESFAALLGLLNIKDGTSGDGSFVVSSVGEATGLAAPLPSNASLSSPNILGRFGVINGGSADVARPSVKSNAKN